MTAARGQAARMIRLGSRLVLLPDRMQPTCGGGPDRLRTAEKSESLVTTTACSATAALDLPRGLLARQRQTTSMAKKWSKTSRFGWLASFVSGLRM